MGDYWKNMPVLVESINYTPINDMGWDIGRDNCCGGGRAGNGNVYSIIRYNRQLTDAEVLQNYNAQKGRFGL